MNIAIITAMPEETRACRKAAGAAESLRIGRFRAFCRRTPECGLLLVESGMGFKNAAAAVEALLGEYRPDLLISAGLCGGVAPELRVGDVAVSRELCIVAQGTVQQVPVELAAAGHNFVARQSAAGARVFASLFAGTPTIMEKRQLAPLLPPGASCPVVEMESAAIAIVAAEHGIPFLGIRTVSDPADEELGFSLDEFTDRDLRIRPHKVALTILRKPWIMPQLIRLARNSRIATDSLAQAVARLLASL
ncbi:phosphorylase [Geobacter sp. FeAm09]|uniref:phosphorylase family protein n=1 Tax=Geobacter sp. FeAm09 TaxID=2597769 RepID=UPI0011EC9421|nr:phosphorylase [Geobacter sp. FeAm09]QEM69981.1 phosphorylase [Geobacter sp. FeAm09]